MLVWLIFTLHSSTLVVNEIMSWKSKIHQISFHYPPLVYHSFLPSLPPFFLQASPSLFQFCCRLFFFLIIVLILQFQWCVWDRCDPTHLLRVCYYKRTKLHLHFKKSNSIYFHCNHPRARLNYCFFLVSSFEFNHNSVHLESDLTSSWKI